MHTRIEHELSFVGCKITGTNYAVSLLNLKYIKTNLGSHAQNLAETVSMLENRATLDWPRIESSPTTEQVAALLLTDFKYVYRRAEELARECEQGMNTLTNSSILEESRRSSDNAMRVQKLTVLATVFIPLSFVCSFWGMNFVELGSGEMRIWAWFAMAGPVVLFCFMIYHLDHLTRFYCKIREKHRR